MQLAFLEDEFSVLKLDSFPSDVLDKPFAFAARTDGECSLVCRSQDAPRAFVSCEPGWRAFRVTGVLDFYLIGILSAITQVLSQARIGVFVISTFDTDYVLVKSENEANAKEALAHAGYDILKPEGNRSL